MMRSLKNKTREYAVAYEKNKESFYIPPPPIQSLNIQNIYIRTNRYTASL